MRWCRFEAQGLAHFGKIEDDRVVRIDGTPFDHPTPTAESHPLSGVKLLPPTIPSTFYSAGVNYRAHILKAQSMGSPVAKFPQRPETGYRANNALTGHDSAIVKPRDYVGRFEAEPEVVAVIGRKIRKCSRSEAEAAIFGWTIGNDVSARAWQYADRTLWRARIDTSGPWVRGSRLMSIRCAHTREEERPDAAIITAADLRCAQISPRSQRYITMYPGDVLWMGSDGNAEMVPDTMN
jgi:2-keto-4-pentenoate hydratase/2-oxohepta-3-ene-1,7-dioic acid hydratase in catechol pathway